MLAQCCNSPESLFRQYESQADVKVLSVDYESQADLKVFKVHYESQAKAKTMANGFY